ncbi:MAG: hypothetical protein QNJ38_13945 [Prochloraceae cyanobacterium]|nr:hypothetical protein [Prochloraceae cyanobacterium]
MKQITSPLEKQNSIENKNLCNNSLSIKDWLGAIFFICGILHIYAFIKKLKMNSPFEANFKA